MAICQIRAVTYASGPWLLTWDEVDPRRHPFDADGAAEVVAELGGTVPARPAPAQPWVNDLTERLAGRYGQWALGWRWAHDEGEIGGGPVWAWCCATHSVTTPEQTLARVTAALLEWRRWLEELAGAFDRHTLDGDRLAWEQGVARLVTMVVDRTRAGDAWYEHCLQVLQWFLARWVFRGTARSRWWTRRSAAGSRAGSSRQGRRWATWRGGSPGRCDTGARRP